MSDLIFQLNVTVNEMSDEMKEIYMIIRQHAKTNRFQITSQNFLARSTDVHDREKN